MIQIPANINDATTGHELQGMSKDVIVVSSWPTGRLATMFKNWEYVVLFCVRTLSGLYLVEPIVMDKYYSNHLQNSKNTLKMQDKKKKYIRKKKTCDSTTKLAVK